MLTKRRGASEKAPAVRGYMLYVYMYMFVCMLVDGKKDVILKQIKLAAAALLLMIEKR